MFRSASGLPTQNLEKPGVVGVVLGEVGQVLASLDEFHQSFLPNRQTPAGEPPREPRRLIGLSHAAIACSSGLA